MATTQPGGEAPQRAPGILFLSPFFAPEMISTGKYNTYLVRGLVDAGWQVEVVCSVPLYPDWIPRAAAHEEPGVTVHRAGARVRYPRSAIGRRLVLEAWFCRHVARSLRRLRGRPRVAVAVFPPVFFTFLLRPLLGKGTHLIGVVHDLQGIMAASSGGVLRRIVSRLVGRVERSALKRCDQLVALSGSMRDVLVERYGVDPARVKVAYPFETLGEIARTEAALADVLPAAAIHVVYAGALGEKQQPDRLYGLLRRVASAAAAPDAAQGGPVRCHIFSAGPAFEALRARAQREREDGVAFHPLVPEAHLPELCERSTVQVIPQAPGTGAGAFPSKLPNLLAAGVPVFAICDADSELASVVRASGAGIVVSTWDEAALAGALRDFIRRVAGEPRGQRRARMAGYVARNFRVEGLIETLALDRQQPGTAPAAAFTARGRGTR